MTAGGPRIAMIAAVARNGVIGRDGDMPWRLPTDLRHFRAVTMGKPVIMGRRTFETLGKPLSGRSNIVLTRDRGFAGQGVEVVHDVPAAEEAGRRAAKALGADEIMVIGGGEIYAAFMGKADRLYLTRVEADPEGDTRFPGIDEGTWREASMEHPPRSDRDSAAVSFHLYERIGSSDG